MIVKCISNKGKDIPILERCGVESDKIFYDFLTINKEYFVYGLKFSKRAEYLIYIGSGTPLWLPSVFFEIIDSKIPDGWGVCMCQFNDGYKPLFDRFSVKAIVGYPDLVNSPYHYGGIIDGDEKELIKFFRWKIYFDGWWKRTQEVVSNPLEGYELDIAMTDPRWPASEGWVKMEQKIDGVEIQYVFNKTTKAVKILNSGE